MLKKPIYKQSKNPFLAYIKEHISLYGQEHVLLQMVVREMVIESETQFKEDPPYWIIVVKLQFENQINTKIRNFILHYDAVIHQVGNHTANIILRNDWENGVVEANSVLGVVKNGNNKTAYQVEINLEEGTIWKGFVGMFWLGVNHIKEGTDHLLFVLTLVLPACLLVENRRWTKYGGAKYSLLRLLKMITAFTIGHSITLAVGALGLETIPVKFIETMVAVSILVTAIHAIRPMFYGREIYVALGFGFIHGLAFSQTLQNLHLAKDQLVLSLFGFNLGIECMQIVVIMIVIPWFILMSQSVYFKYIKNILAVLVSIAALGWIAERITEMPNVVSQTVDNLFTNHLWFVLSLAILSVLSYFLSRNKLVNT